MPRNKKEVQAFFGTINFSRRFIPNYADIVKGITYILKKENEIKWGFVPCDSFTRIKEALVEVPALVSPDYSVPFYIFYFTSPQTIATVLLQKIKKVTSNPLPFFIQVLRDAELKHDILEKQAYALVKALNSFRMYVLQSEITTFVPTTAVKEILVQGDNEGKRGRWIAKIQEYELEIKPTKLIKGKGLAKILSESNFQAKPL